MPVCPLDDNNYCSRHECRHIGALREIALDPTSYGEKYRMDWDRFRDEKKAGTVNGKKVISRVITEEELRGTKKRNLRDPLERLPCSHRGKPTGELYECTSCVKTTQVVYNCDKFGKCVLSALTNDDAIRTCKTCREREVIQPEAPVPVEMPTPTPPKSTHRYVKWAYGVTAVPERRKDLLPRTLASLRNAGFPFPHLFVDGDGDGKSWSDEFGLPVTAHPERLKVVGNWITALWELYVLHPGATRYVLFQDDILCVANLRDYLESCSFPEKGYWNLYSWKWNEAIRPRGQVPVWYEGLELRNTPDNKPNTEHLQVGLGALGLVFSREGVQKLLSSRSLVEKPASVKKPDVAIDGGIVTAMNAVGFREYVHYPSLLGHTGEKRIVPTVSGRASVPHPPNASFPGESFNAKQWVDKQA